MYKNNGSQSPSATVDESLHDATDMEIYRTTQHSLYANVKM